MKLDNLEVALQYELLWPAWDRLHGHEDLWLEPRRVASPWPRDEGSSISVGRNSGRCHTITGRRRGSSLRSDSGW